MVNQQQQQQQQQKQRKPSMGRRKIQIKKIENKGHLEVTFSKRRKGLFKKAAELCILCGAHIGIIVFSPHNKVYTFGHPSVDSIVNSFINNNNDHHHNAIVVDHHHNHNHHQQQQQQQHDVEVLNQLIEAEKKRRQGIEKLIRDRKEQVIEKLFWWEDLSNIDDMGLEELEQVRSSMEELKRNLSTRIHELETKAAFPTNSSNNMSSSILDVDPIDIIDPYSYSGGASIDDHHQTASIVPYHGTSNEGAQWSIS